MAMIRLLKPLAYYREKYGSVTYGLNRLYLLMEKQHNRGQEGAGVGVVKFDSAPGTEYLFRERATGSGAIQEIFSAIGAKVEESEDSPFIGNLYMGHLRYSTTGCSGLSYVHPFLRRNNWPSRNLLLCGNFNMTNVDTLFQAIVSRGQHPRIYSDTIMLLEQLGYALDRENSRLYADFKTKYREPELTQAIESNLNMENLLHDEAPLWDGGFVICGATGSGDMFVLRDSHGIRPAFYYANDELVVVASERPVIQTVFNVPRRAVHELTPGSALTVSKAGELKISDILGEGRNARCSFERIYFSRGSDADIYHDRKELGRNLVPAISRLTDEDVEHTVFSFIPNTAEVAFIGMIEGLEERLSSEKCSQILKLQDANLLTKDALEKIMGRKLRVEKIAIKDIKLRTFIAESESRNDLAAHVYDVSYGCIQNGKDTIVAIDDSIVRGTTLKQSIITMLDRLHPKRIVIVSSSPQVRYPDCYGIDMSRMEEFAAFRAAVQLLRESGRENILEETYRDCLAMAEAPDDELKNCVKRIYEPFTDDELAHKIAEMLTPEGTFATVDILFQSIEGLRKAIPNCPGDWYFSGDYPTPGGIRLVNRAFVNFYEGHPDRR